MPQKIDPRFAAFDKKIEAAKPEPAKASQAASDVASAASGMRIGAELITAPFAGAFIGYGLDRWLETKPIFMVALLILGVITGFVNVWRLTNNLGSAVGYKPSQPNANTHDSQNKG